MRANDFKKHRAELKRRFEKRKLELETELHSLEAELNKSLAAIDVLLPHVKGTSKKVRATRKVKESRVEAATVESKELPLLKGQYIQRHAKTGQKGHILNLAKGLGSEFTFSQIWEKAEEQVPGLTKRALSTVLYRAAKEEILKVVHIRRGGDGSTYQFAA